MALFTQAQWRLRRCSWIRSFDSSTEITSPYAFIFLFAERGLGFCLNTERLIFTNLERAEF